jgi:hypothetical protein
MKINQTQTYKNLKDNTKDNFPQMIIMHHSGGTDANPYADTSHHTAKIIEEWHLKRFTNSRGLGYHYVIHSDGSVWAGRPEHISGAHTINYNAKSIGICLTGNFDINLPTEEQELALIELVKDIYSRNGNLEIREHREFAKKTCPGSNLKPGYFAELIAKYTEPKRELLDNEPEAVKLAEKEATVPDTAYTYMNDPIGLIEGHMTKELSLPQQAFEYIVYSSKDPQKIGATGKAIGALLVTHFINPLSEIFPQLAQIDAVQAVQTSLFYFGVAYGVFGILRKSYYELKSYLDKKKEDLSILQ